jgi:hypothetical protein
VKGILTGQDWVFLHDASGRPMNKLEESCTARYSGRGTCTRAGQLEGFGMGQLRACCGVEYWIPHTFWQGSVPLTSTHWQPHLNFGVSNKLLMTLWRTMIMTQRYIGTMINRMVPFLLRFCKVTKYGPPPVSLKLIQSVYKGTVANATWTF